MHDSIKSLNLSKSRWRYLALLWSKLTQTNEMTWSHSGDLFLLTNGAGKVKILAWPSLEVLHTLEAHTSNCLSIEFDPRGR
jgi:WD40 repeat protein